MVYVIYFLQKSELPISILIFTKNFEYVVLDRVYARTAVASVTFPITYFLHNKGIPYTRVT